MRGSPRLDGSTVLAARGEIRERERRRGRGKREIEIENGGTGEAFRSACVRDQSAPSASAADRTWNSCHALSEHFAVTVTWALVPPILPVVFEESFSRASAHRAFREMRNENGYNDTKAC